MVKKELGGGVDMESHITEHHLSKIMVLVGFFFLSRCQQNPRFFQKQQQNHPQCI